MQTDLTKEQLIEYARANVTEEVKFSVKKNGEYAFSGEILDAYKELVTIPYLNNRFIPLNNLIEILGGTVTFEIVPYEFYCGKVRIDYVKSGQAIPKHFR